MKKELNIVWLKRDIRTIDHVSMYEAENLKVITLLFIFGFKPNELF